MKTIYITVQSDNIETLKKNISLLSNDGWTIQGDVSKKIDYDNPSDWATFVFVVKMSKSFK